MQLLSIFGRNRNIVFAAKAEPLGFAYLRNFALVVVTLDIIIDSDGACALRILYAVQSVAICIIKVYRHFAAIFAHKGLKLIKLRFGRHGLKVYSSHFRGNANVALVHELNHGIRATYSFGIVQFAYIAVIHTAVSRLCAIPFTGEV